MPVTSPPTGLRAIPLGLRYMVGAAFFFSLMTLFVKLAGRTLPTMEIVFARSFFMAVVMFGLIRREGLSPLGNDRKLLLLRGLVGATALSLLYFSVSRIPLGDATALFYMAPIWTALSAALILKERTARLVLVGMAASLVGVVAIAKPTFLFGSLDALDPLAIAAVVTASVLSGLVYTIVRQLRTTDTPNVIIFYLSFVGVLIALPFAGNWVWPSGIGWVWLLCVSVVTLAGQLFLTHGLHLEKAGRAVSVGYLQIVFAFVWDALIFGDVPDLLCLLGAVVIVSSVLLIARQK